MVVNNELGVVQPVSEIAAVAHERSPVVAALLADVAAYPANHRVDDPTPHGRDNEQGDHEADQHGALEKRELPFLVGLKGSHHVVEGG